jgi:hypothetical protein
MAMGTYDPLAVMDDFIGRSAKDPQLAKLFADHKTDSLKRIRQLLVEELLTSAAVGKGRSISCYPAIEPEVNAVGGNCVDLPLTEANVDGNPVTGAAWTARPAWLAEFLKVVEARQDVSQPAETRRTATSRE